MAVETRRILVNGVERDVGAPGGDGSLLDWLRDGIGLTGTKYGCGEASCGACSVLVDGGLARACVVPLVDVVGHSVTTVEGLARDGVLHRVQRAFVDANAMQCGFCTPGMVMAAVALLDAHPDPSDDEVVQWMTPNVCRCGVHPRIVRAIRAAAGQPVSGEPAPGAEAAPALSARPRAPWDLVAVDDRDYFAVLGEGLVVVAPPPAGAPGTWAPTGGAWIHVGPGGAVTAFTGKVEVGQGTRRALRIVVAETMGVALDAVRLVMGDTDVCPFDIGTFGSLGIPTAAPDLRRAAAGARVVLERATAQPLGPRHVEIVESDAVVEVPPRPARPHTGEIAAVTGAKTFAADLRRPGMQYGAILRAPQYRARLQKVDVSAATAQPDVTVIADGELVAVAAPTRAAARAALAAIDAQWEVEPLVAESELEAHLRSHPVESEGWGGRYALDDGDVDAALSIAAVRAEATYTTAYIAHAPIETRVALAEWDADRLTVWTGTQTPFRVRSALADALGIEEHMVRVIVPDTGTGFGGKHEPDVAIIAARLARAAGAAVNVQWTREEEFTWAYFRPAAIIDVRAGASSDGDLLAWEFVDTNAGNAALGVPYTVPNQRLRFEPAESPLRQGSYRALAATANNFARESMLDELAHELRVDPLELRLHNLHDDRLVAVLRAAADRFGWDDPPREPGDGVGIAAGVEKGGRVATCVHVRVDGDRLDILRIVTAFECGAIVDPDNLRSQIEGATIMGLGGALFEAIRFDAAGITNPRFSEYRVPRFPDVPPLDVVLLDRPDLPSAGGGETPIITIAPALANALFDATGRRIRALPLLEHDR